MNSDYSAERKKVRYKAREAAKQQIRLQHLRQQLEDAQKAKSLPQRNLQERRKTIAACDQERALKSYARAAKEEETRRNACCARAMHLQKSLKLEENKQKMNDSRRVKYAEIRRYNARIADLRETMQVEVANDNRRRHDEILNMQYRARENYEHALVERRRAIGDQRRQEMQLLEIYKLEIQRTYERMDAEEEEIRLQIRTLRGDDSSNSCRSG